MSAPHSNRILSTLVTTSCIAASCVFLPAFADNLTIYSARTEVLLKPILDAYKKETGTQITVVTDKEPVLVERLKAEGASSPADLLITVDAGNLWQAAKEGVLRPVQSKILETNIPAHLRDKNNLWFGLSVRARTIFHNRNMVKASELSTYEDLADPKWKGKLCLRSSKSVYNQSLIAMQIAEHGVEKTEKMVKGWVANLVTPPFSDDTKLLEAIGSGQCPIAIANTYYFGQLINKKPNLPIKIFWANQASSGVHVNVSGAGITKYAKNPAGAQKLLEWLASSEAQNLFADDNFEFPANPAIKPAKLVAGWGNFKPNLINLSAAGDLQDDAVRLMDRAGYK